MTVGKTAKGACRTLLGDAPRETEWAELVAGAMPEQPTSLNGGKLVSRSGVAVVYAAERQTRAATKMGL